LELQLFKPPKGPKVDKEVFLGYIWGRKRFFMEKSSAAQVIIAIIPLVGIVMGSVVVFFYLLWNHRRKILQIKAGQYQKPDFDLLAFSLLAGLLLTALGISLTVLLGVMGNAGYGLLGGVIPLSIGVGLLGYFFIKRGNRSP
jgi:hypothetical protein